MLAVIPCTTAYADEPSDAVPPVLDRVDAHEDVVKTHRRDGAVADVVADIEQAVTLFREAEAAPDREKAQARLVKLVGSICRRMRDDDVRKAALEAMGEMAHEDCARYLKRFLKPVRDEDDRLPPTLLPAIEAAGCVADASLVRPLLEIVEDSENYLAAAKAAEALGAFKDVKFRYHKLILETLGTTLIKDRPGGPSRGHSDPQTGSYIPGKQGSSGNLRWSTLSVAIPKGLNELTGQEFATIEDWMAMIDEHDRNLKILFRNRYRDDD